MLKFLQCHLVQGHLYSKAVSADEFASRMPGPVMPAVALAAGTG
jgi:hypothetical protein